MNLVERGVRWLQKHWTFGPEGWRFSLARETASGEAVTPLRSLQLVTVWACVSLLADMDAMAPIDVCRKHPDGRIERIKHPIEELLNWEPNSEMSAFDLAVFSRVSEELYGNSLIWKVTSSKGTLGELYPLSWPHVTVQRVGTFRQLVYRYEPGGGVPAREFSSDEVVHHRGRITKDGVIGLSPIEQCAEAMGVSLATEKYGSSWFKNGAMPSILWVNEGPPISEKAEKNFLDSQKQALSGSDNAHKIGLAQGNFKLNTLSINPQQSQFLETRGFNQLQIVQLFRMPPHLVSITEKVTSWGTGIAEQNTGFATYTLGPRFVANEKQYRRSLLTREEKASGLYLKRNIGAILRADIKGRYEAYTSAINTGWMQPNEARSLEDLSPAPGLDHYRFPLNTAYFDDAGNLVTPKGTAVPTAPEASR